MPITKRFSALCFGAALLAVYSATPAYSQEKPAYIVAEAEVLDATPYQDYVKQAVALVGKMGGQFLVRGGTSIPTAPEGAVPRRVSIIKFENRDKAQAFQSSEEFAKLKVVRDRTSHTHSFIIEGTAP